MFTNITTLKEDIRHLSWGLEPRIHSHSIPLTHSHTHTHTKVYHCSHSCRAQKKCVSLFRVLQVSYHVFQILEQYMQYTYKRNTERSSRNHTCRGKAVGIIPTECL